jgi:hypothetical protein
MFEPIALTHFATNPQGFTETFKHQFLIMRGDETALPGWTTYQEHGFCVTNAPDLPSTELLDSQGQHIGWVLGIAIDAAGQAIKGTRRIDATLGAGDFITRFEDFLEGCAGRYVMVLLTEGANRLYLDPVGDLAAVYDPENGRAGSTNLIVQDRDFIDNPDFPYMRVRTGELAYTLGHTRDAKVRRLLASHYLDLDRMDPVRHWPRPDTDIRTRTDQTEILAINDAITSRLQQIFCEILRTESVIMPLSGGRDSRCLLGTGMPEIQRADSLFTWRFHKQSGLDSERAKQICTILDLPHKEYGFQRLNREIKMTYLRRNGFAVFGTALQSVAISESLPGGHVMVRGNIMGILRATNWQRQREGKLNLTHALRRFRSGLHSDELHQKLAPKFMAYYDAMPPNAQNKIYDIAWTDITLTHGQGARTYGTPQNFILNAYNDRKLLQLSMQLPLPYRRRDTAYDRIVETTLPQLDGVPYV